LQKSGREDESSPPAKTAEARLAEPDQAHTAEAEHHPEPGSLGNTFSERRGGDKCGEERGNIHKEAGGTGTDGQFAGVQRDVVGRDPDAPGKSDAKQIPPSRPVWTDRQ